MSRELPWQKVGMTYDNSKSVAENLNIAGLDYHVMATPVYYKNPDLELVPTREAIITEDTGEFIAEAKRGSTLIQNEDAFNIIEPLQKEYGAEVVKIGVDTRHKSPFMVCKMPQVDIMGDPMDPYVVVRNFQDGTKQPLRVFSTPIRVFCQNQLTALENQKTSVVFKTGNAYKDYDSNRDIARFIIDALVNRQTRMKSRAEAFTDVKVSNDEFERIVEEFYPIHNKELTASKITKNEYYRDALMSAYKSDDLNNIRGTAYGVINAFADFSQHTRPYIDVMKEKDIDYDAELEKIQVTSVIMQDIMNRLSARHGVRI